MNRMFLYITLITLAMSLANTASDADTVSATPMAALVTTVPVVERRVAESLLVYGSVEPAPQQNLTLAAIRDSIIASVAVNSSERVRKGQVLITLTPTPQSRAAWVQAKSGLSYTQTAVERTRSLYKEHLATREQLAAAEKALSDAQVMLAVAQQAGGGGPLALRASRDAVVTSVLVNTGEQVVANTALLTLAANGGLQARLGVAPEQAAALHSGFPVTLHSVFDDNKTVTGKIAAVGGMLDINTGLLDVFVPLSHAARGFLPGTQVQGEINLSDNSGLAVPRTAVLRDAHGAYVFVINKNNKARRVNVQISADDGAWIAVHGNLKAGESVVTLGNYELTDGILVREPAR